jgi:hypothetical protein
MSERRILRHGTRVRGTYGIVHISKCVPNSSGRIISHRKDNRGCVTVRWDNGQTDRIHVDFLEPVTV